MDIRRARGHRRHHSSSSSSFLRPPPPAAFSFSSSRSVKSHICGGGGGSSRSDEPSSPKLGCMGGIRRSKTLSRSAAADATRGREGKLLKTLLAGIFSRRSETGRRSYAAVDDHHRRCSASVDLVSVADLDPPLPVVQRVAGKADPISLWSRRCGGGEGLKCLQLEEPKLHHMHRQPTYRSRA